MAGNVTSGGEGFRPFMDQLRDDTKEAEKWVEDYLAGENPDPHAPEVSPHAMMVAYMAGLRSGRKAGDLRCTATQSVEKHGAETDVFAAPQQNERLP